MKYMESCRQSLVELRNADEIKINYKDIDRIRDFVSAETKYDADFIIYVTREEQETVDWEMLKSYQPVLNIIIALEDTFFSPKVKELNFPWFWAFPVMSFWELRGILDLKPCQVIIDAPIFFELPKVYEQCKEAHAEIRVVANQCFNKYMPRRTETGVFGVYIRPEDLRYYEPYVQHIEFESDNLSQERALVRIFKQQRAWPGNLNLLFPKFGINVDNRGFDSNFGQRRLSCRQRCQSTGRCRYCRIQVDLINAIQKNQDWIKQQLN